MISILMSVYNDIEYINETILSVINQTYDKWELLIGINGNPQSSDVYKIVQKYETISNKIKVFDFYKITGKANTLNHLIKYCLYDYVAILEIGDIWLNNKLKVQSQHFDKYDVIGSNCMWIGKKVEYTLIVPCGDISKFDFTKENPVIISSSIIKKQLYYLDPLEVLNDYDLWLKLRLSNKKFYNCDDVLVCRRMNKKSNVNSKRVYTKHLVKDLFQKYNLVS